jgi:hypothetical protein
LIAASIFTFSFVSVGLLSERWFDDDPNSEVRAGKLVAIMWFLCAILIPLFGLMYDFLGKISLMVNY